MGARGPTTPRCTAAHRALDGALHRGAVSSHVRPATTEPAPSYEREPADVISDG